MAFSLATIFPVILAIVNQFDVDYLQSHLSTCPPSCEAAGGSSS